MPWLGLGLAVTFGTYGLIKKTVPLLVDVEPDGRGRRARPPALAMVAVLELAGAGTLTGHGAVHVALLVSAGP